MSREDHGIRCNAIHQLFIGIDKAYQILRGFYGPAYSSSEEHFFKGRGYHILSRIELSDPIENAGICFVRSLAKQVYDLHADGVISSVILLRSFLKTALPFIDQGLSPQLLVSALTAKKNTICSYLKSQSFPLKDASKVPGLIRSHFSDPIIEKTFAEAFVHTGQKGTISLSQTSGSSLHLVKGLQIQKGYEVPSFFPQDSFHENPIVAPKIFVLDQKIHSLFSILPLLKQLSEERIPLIIFCKEVAPELLATCAANRIAGLLDVMIVTISDPLLLEDIALLTGTTVFSTPPFSNKPPINLPLLGSCTWAELSKDQTLLVCENLVPELVRLKIRQLDHAIQNAEDEYSQNILEERKRRLEHTVALVPIKQENASLYRLALKTLNTTKESGFVLGGGATLLYAAQSLLTLPSNSQEEKAASHILQVACRSLLEQLVNSVHMDGKLVADKLCTLETPSLGFNVLSQQIEDMISAEILSPLNTVMDIFSYSLRTAIDLLLVAYTTPSHPIAKEKNT